MLGKIADAKGRIDMLKEAVAELDANMELSLLVDQVCEKLPALRRFQYGLRKHLVVLYISRLRGKPVA